MKLSRWSRATLTAIAIAIASTSVAARAAEPPPERAEAEVPEGVGDQRLALGLELGEASGATVGYTWLDNHEVSGLFGYSLFYESLTLRTDYLYRFYRWVPARKYGVMLTFFGGAGARLGLFEPRPSFLREPRFALGARVPIGVAASMPPLPAELVATLAPGGDLIPTLRFRMEGAIGLRFYIDPRPPSAAQ